MKALRTVLLAMPAALLLLADAAQAQTSRRSRVYQEPELLRLKLTQAQAGLYFEGDYDTSTFNDKSTVTHDRIFFGPLLGASLDGSIYHPNFCTLHAYSEGAFGETWESVSSAAGTTRTTKLDYRGRFIADANFLNNKPYRLGLFSSYDHAFRDYDFFNRVTLDSLNYGARLSYDEGPWSLSSTVSRRDEKVSDIDVPSESTVDTLGFDLRHNRTHGSSSLGYTFNQFDYSGGGGSSNTGEDQNFTLSDDEKFGSRQQIDLNNRASYLHHAANSEAASDQFLAASELSIEHKHGWSSSYSLNFDRYESGNLTSESYSGVAGVNHQLYESLRSSLALSVLNADYSDQNSDGYNRSYSVIWVETYTKHLTAEHTLRAYNSMTLQRVEQKGVSTVENELHSSPSAVGDPNVDRFNLNQPNAIVSSISLRNSTTSQPYFVGIDYEVIVNGSVTEIHRLLTGGIPSGASVLVDYQAEPRPEGGYDNIGDSFRVRLEFWNNLWAVFAGVSLSTANAPDSLRVQNYVRYTVGTEFNWRWFRTGADAEYYDATDSQYESLGFYQTANFTLDDASTLGLNLSEQWFKYIDANRQEQNYRFVMRYRRFLARNLSVDFDAGVSERVGRDVDQTLALVRPELRYSIGKTTIAASYSYDYELSQKTEERTRHKLLLTLKRYF